MADATPKHVYKIVPEAPPQPIPQEFPLSELDRSDGFVHLSTATQVSLHHQTKIKAHRKPYTFRSLSPATASLLRRPTCGS